MLVLDIRRRLGLLNEPDFRRFYLSAVGTQFGLRILVLALPLVAVLELEVNELQVGVLAACSTAAFLIIGLPAGAWVDRARRRLVLITAYLAQAAILATVPMAWWAGVLTIWQLYAVALLSGTCGVFLDVAQQSYLPRLVGRGRLLEANTKLQGIRAVSQIAGPGIAGQLVQVVTAPFALVANVVTLGLSALLVGRIRTHETKPDRRPDANLLKEIGEGLRFVVGQPTLRAIAACNATFNLSWAAFGAMLIFFLARDLSLSEGMIGFFFMFAGVGSVIGLSVNRRAVALVGQGRALWIAPAASSPFLLLVPLAQPGATVWVAAGGYFLVSIGQVIYNVTQVSFRQRLTPERLLGRMSATMRFLVWGVMPLGGLAGGALGQWLGARPTMVVFGAIASVAFVPILLSPVSAMRELPTTAEDEPSGPASAGSARG